jgi:hypothetical protein
MKQMLKKEIRKSRSKPAISAMKPTSLPDGVRERIAQKAYELWELRGRRHGSAVQDWLDAEMLVMDEIYEARQ